VLLLAVDGVRGRTVPGVQPCTPPSPDRPLELELQRPIGDRTLKPIIQGISRLIGRFYPANTVKSVSLKLKRAGMEGTSVEFFLGVKGFAAVVGAIAGSAILNLLTSDLTATVGGLAGGVLIGFMAPDFYLSSKAG